MKRRAPGGVDGGAPGAKTRKWQDEISDSESLDEADLELPPSSDDDSPPKSSNAAILSPGGPEEASSSSLVGGGTAAAPAPPGDNTNMTAEQTTSSAPGGALTESEKRKRFLVQSFVRLSFSFGGSTRCDLVVETRVICQLPKKLKVERISGLVVTLIEVKDEIKAEREQRRRGEEKLLAFAGLGMTDVFASKEGGLNVPKPSEFPDEQGVLGVGRLIFIASLVSEAHHHVQRCTPLESIYNGSSTSFSRRPPPKRGASLRRTTLEKYDPPTDVVFPPTSWS